MSSGSNSLTTYYAKRIIGDTAAANASSALLQTGTGIDTNTWILNRTNRASTYGIKYVYDSSTSTVEEDGQEPVTVNNGHDKIEFHGGGANASAWVQLDTGDAYILGNLGVGTDPSGSSFKLSVNGSAYFADHIYIERNNKAKAIIFQQYGSSARIGVIKYDSGDAENITSGQFTFAEYSPKSTPDTSSTGYRENYTLPVCTTGLSADATYNILNTKENASPAIGTANYVAYYSATGTISDGKSSTSMRMPGHYYHNLYNDDPVSGTTVYVHYYNNDTTSTNSFANLRVKSGSSYKVLAFGGDGTFTWDGTNVVTNSGTWDISITGNAATANILNNDGGRRASSEYMHADGKLRFYLATSSMSTGKPPTGDGFILKGGWDNTGGWDAMISWSNSGHMSVRGTSGSGNATNHTQAWKAWSTILDSDNYTSYTVTKTGSGASGSWGISVTGSAGSVAWANVSGRPTIDKTTVIYQISRGANFDPIQSGYFAGMSTSTGITSDWWHILSMDWSGNDAGNWISQLALPTQNRTGVYYRSRHSSSTYAWKKLWTSGESITNAVWNDYAEYRESDCNDFGYVLTEKGDDTLTKTTERLQHFAGISSNTWGFAQGETEKAKTPIAVAGRVLVYPYKNRNLYKPGDVLCAAPGGTVDIMTREEVINYPDRIVGTVSCIPEYEEWGGSNLEIENRPPIKVNGRIWIKVR